MKTHFVTVYEKNIFGGGDGSVGHQALPIKAGPFGFVGFCVGFVGFFGGLMQALFREETMESWNFRPKMPETSRLARVGSHLLALCRKVFSELGKGQGVAAATPYRVGLWGAKPAASWRSGQIRGKAELDLWRPFGRLLGSI
jgi:hypothetical protein